MSSRFGARLRSCFSCSRGCCWATPETHVAAGAMKENAWPFGSWQRRRIRRTALTRCSSRALFPAWRQRWSRWLRPFRPARIFLEFTNIRRPAWTSEVMPSMAGIAHPSPFQPWVVSYQAASVKNFLHQCSDRATHHRECCGRTSSHRCPRAARSRRVFCSEWFTRSMRDSQIVRACVRRCFCLRGISSAQLRGLPQSATARDKTRTAFPCLLGNASARRRQDLC
jgi:hypothetical protein